MTGSAHALLALGLWLAVAVAAGAYKTYEGYSLLSTAPLSEQEAASVAAAGSQWDFWEEPKSGAAARVLVSPEEASAVTAALDALGVAFETQPAPTPAPPPTRRQRGVSDIRAVTFTDFHRLADIQQYLYDTAKLYPELATVLVAGQSLEGRNITVLKISSGNAPSGKPKPAAFIDAAIHAREWIAPPVALYTILQLVENYSANKELVDALDWYILPVVNPDGYEYTHTDERFWRKTRSFNGDPQCLGVDANRNFGCHWAETGSSDNQCSQTFGGLTLFSESESRAVASFVKKIPGEVRLFLTLHSYGPLLMYPWGYTTELPEDVDELEAAAIAAANALEAVRGTKYTIGSSANVLYASSGTSRDWAKCEGIKFVYTMELPPGGSGFDPPPEDIIPVVTETWEAIKVLGRAAGGLKI